MTKFAHRRTPRSLSLVVATTAALAALVPGGPAISAPLQPTDLHQFSRMNQVVGIVDAYAYPSIIGGIVFNRMLAPRLGLPVDEAAVRTHVLKAWDLELGAGLGPLKGKVWRIGLMGASATPWHVRLCLTALCEALTAQGVDADVKSALAASDARLAA